MCKGNIFILTFVAYFMNYMQRPLIFITNDDSFRSKGIKLLISLMQKFGDVVVVAPSHQQSGKSHSITVHDPLRYHKIEESEGYKAYICSGTPVDCVKIAFNILFKDIKPDLVVSGINHGSNASINTIYSGTMAAVFEGCAEGIPSIGFSLDSSNPEADFTHCIPLINKITKEVLENGLDDMVCLNVNFPEKEIKGLKVCHQAKAYWNEDFLERKDPTGQSYYWLTGVYNCQDENAGADYNALQEGYCSITPMQVDFTAYQVIESYKKRFE